MIDTMTVTKVGGALCGSLLIFLLAKWGAETLYHTGPSGHGEGVTQAYVIEIAAAPEAPADVAEGPAFAEVLATADAAAGEKVFSKCKACHKIDGNNGVGPHLDGVVDRDVASVAGYAYSDPLAALEGAWSAEALNGFLENPKGYTPGTKMSFAGLPKIEDRANVVAYLQGLGG